jgi:prepilin-type N-terminal cleavage/methylation domain-containing protein
MIDAAHHLRLAAVPKGRFVSPVKKRPFGTAAKRRSRAFTLIEVITVVVILAILAAIALPNLATQSDLTLSAASRVVVADLLYAQSQAVATGQNQSVTFTVASNQPGGGDGWYSVSSLNPITKAPYTQTFGVGLATPLADVALADVNFDDAAITVLTFGPLGQPMASPVNGSPVALASTGTIELQCGSEKVTVSIEPDTGNVTVSNVTEN